MSIQLTCRCGKSFFAEPHWAGQRARCPSCGADLEIPAAGAAAEAPRPGPSYLPAQPGKSSFNPLLLLWVAGGAVLLLVVAMVVMTIMAEREEPVADGPTDAPPEAGDGSATPEPASSSPTPDDAAAAAAVTPPAAEADDFPFDQPPSNPEIRVVTEPWVANPALVERLAAPLQLGALSIQLPPGFFRTEPANGAFTWERPSRVAATRDDTILVKVQSWDREPEELARFESQHLQEIKKESAPGSSGRVERGRLGRIFCLRRTYRAASTPPLYHCAYQLLDGDKNLVVEMRTYSPPDTPDYKILETALRTISRRSR